MCAPFTAETSLCNDIISSNSYVYTLPGSAQSSVSASLDLLVSTVAENSDSDCRELVSTILCNYFFSPCGSTEGVHLPLSLCEEECVIVRDNCSALWTQVQEVMEEQNIEAIVCNETTSRFNGLSACCRGIDIGMIRTIFQEINNI